MKELLQNTTEGSEHENKRKIPKWKMEIKTGITDWQRVYTKGRIWSKMEELWDERDGWRGPVAR
jgi:hypothetical protein